MRRRRELSQRERAEIWKRYGSGESLRSISRGTRRDMGTLRRLIASTGGTAATGAAAVEAAPVARRA